MNFRKIIELGFISNQEMMIDKFKQFYELDTITKFVEYLWPLWFAYSVDLISSKFPCGKI